MFLKPIGLISKSIRYFHCTKRLMVVGLIFAGGFSQTVFSKDYMVEVLVFENLNEQRAHDSNNYVEPAEMVSETETWQLEPSMLNEAATSITESENYQLLHHFSWGQEALPYSESAAFEITEQNTRGWIKIYANHLLFANIDIDFIGYRLSEKRRLKLNEKHFFDHPKYGILMQVSRLETDEDGIDQIEE